MDSAPPGLRANYAASTNMTMGVATFLGSIIGGIFASRLSALVGERQALFMCLILAAILRLISDICLFFIKETLPKKDAA